jgi:ferredoxin
MILYFSGTGNSLYVARSLAHALGDSLCHINNAPADLTHENQVGLVFPVYTYDAPAAVKTFADPLVLNKDAYVFVVATCGSTPGNAILSVKQRLEKNGASVAYSRIVSMPDCSAPAMNNNPNDQLKKLETVPTLLEQMTADIKARKHDLLHAKCTAMGTIMNTRAMQPIGIAAVRQYVNMDKCIGCGICTKVCPMENIVLACRDASNASVASNASASAQIGDCCTQCLACVHFCPQQAMEIRHKPMPKEWQYHHPKVTLKDMLLR